MFELVFCSLLPGTKNKHEAPCSVLGLVQTKRMKRLYIICLQVIWASSIYQSHLTQNKNHYTVHIVCNVKCIKQLRFNIDSKARSQHTHRSLVSLYFCVCVSFVWLLRMFISRLPSPLIVVEYITIVQKCVCINLLQVANLRSRCSHTCKMQSKRKQNLIFRCKHSTLTRVQRKKEHRKKAESTKTTHTQTHFECSEHYSLIKMKQKINNKNRETKHQILC